MVSWFQIQLFLSITELDFKEYFLKHTTVSSKSYMTLTFETNNIKHSLISL